jgi:DNA-directed RNA polymerase subunit L
MELSVLEKGKDSVTVEFKDVDEAIIHLFVTEVLKNSDVKEATYLRRRPEEEKYEVSVRMKKGRALTATKKAAENLSTEFKKSREMLQKELKKKPKKKSS